MFSDKHNYRIAYISAPEALSEAVHLTAFLSFSRVARLVAAAGVAERLLPESVRQVAARGERRCGEACAHKSKFQ